MGRVYGKEKTRSIGKIGSNAREQKGSSEEKGLYWSGLYKLKTI
jgi:hypothetical protein